MIIIIKRNFIVTLMSLKHITYRYSWRELFKTIVILPMIKKGLKKTSTVLSNTKGHIMHKVGFDIEDETCPLSRGLHHVSEVKKKVKKKFRSHTLNFLNTHEAVDSVYDCYMHHHKRCRFKKYIYNYAFLWIVRCSLSEI